MESPEFVFDFPVWISVDESAIWEAGLPHAIVPALCKDGPFFALFTDRDLADRYAAFFMDYPPEKRLAIRPMKICLASTFRGILLDHKIGSGLKGVAVDPRPGPNQTPLTMSFDTALDAITAHLNEQGWE
jgi:hypothetical protein